MLTYAPLLPMPSLPIQAQSIRLSQVWRMVQRAIVTNTTGGAAEEGVANDHRSGTGGGGSGGGGSGGGGGGSDLHRRVYSDVELDRLLHSPGAVPPPPQLAARGTKGNGQLSRTSPEEDGEDEDRDGRDKGQVVRMPVADGTVEEFGRNYTGGACYCYCSGDQAIGKCGKAANASECESLTSGMGVTGAKDVRDYCPNITYITDCFDRIAYGAVSVCKHVNNTAPSENSTVVSMGAATDERMAKPHPPPPKHTKHKLSSLFGMQFDPFANTSCPTSPQVNRGFEAISTCTYYPVKFGKCFFVPNVKSCEYSPFFPEKA